MKFFRDLRYFIQHLYLDKRIPKRDRIVLMILSVLLVSPFDFIPDWIPFFGLLDDFIIIAMILNYFFKVLDSRIILSHYPWTMTSFSRLRALANISEFFIPQGVKKIMWKYVGDPY